MMVLGIALVCSGLAVEIAGTIRYGWRLTLADLISIALVGAGNAVEGGILGTAICAVLLVWASWRWWRKRRKRAPRTLGAKARARIAAMVTRMRERPARPALRPVHGGAR